MGLIICLLVSGCRSTGDRIWLDQALAHRELEAGNAGRAIELLDRCKKDRPDYAPTYLSLAAAWAQRGDRDRFRENMAIYRELNPTHDVADLYLAEAEFKEGHGEQADLLFQDYLQATQNQFDAKTLARRIHALSRRAEVAHQQGETQRSHLLRARVESTKAWWLAIAPNEAGVDGGDLPKQVDPKENRQQEILASLATSLDELQMARQLSATPEGKSLVDREIDIVRKMLEDADSGRLADLAFILAAHSDVETTPSAEASVLEAAPRVPEKMAAAGSNAPVNETR
jgi:hypothetical protein